MSVESRKVATSFNKFFPDGLIKYEQLSQLLKNLSPGFPESALESIWSNQDKDADSNVKVFMLLADLFGDVFSAIGLRRLTTAMSSEEGKLELKALFDKLDKDANGKISSKEWGSAVSTSREMMSKYFGGSSAKEIGQAFRWIDADGSKDLSWEEFVDATTEFEIAIKASDAMATEEGRAELKALFDTLDKNSDGKVSSKEWGSGVSKNKEIMAKYFGGSNVGAIGRAFGRIDTNRDKQLSWEEFVDAVCKFR